MINNMSALQLAAQTLFVTGKARLRAKEIAEYVVQPEVMPSWRTLGIELERGPDRLVCTYRTDARPARAECADKSEGNRRQQTRLVSGAEGPDCDFDKWSRVRSVRIDPTHRARR